MNNYPTYYINCPYHEARSDLIKECKICDDNGLLEVIDRDDDDMMYMLYLRQQKLIDLYKREIEPFVHQRMRLASLFTQLILMPDGTVIHRFSPEVEAMDKECEKWIDETRERIFGSSKGLPV